MMDNTSLQVKPGEGSLTPEKDKGHSSAKKQHRGFMSRSSNNSLPGSGRRSVLVMGGTGLVGGAVVRGLLSYPWFRVLVATRRPWCAEAILLKQAGASVVEVDFNYKHSLVVAMQDVKCVFLHTMYWENYSCALEIVHGRNAVEAALEAGVEHLVFNGTNYVPPDNGRVCSFLRSKLEIEYFIKESGISYTIVVLPFYFENFLTVFRPFVLTRDLFAMTLPLENCLISCACLHDMALCICKIIQQGAVYQYQKLTLAAEMLSVQQMTSNLTKGLEKYSFIDPNLTVEDFQEFDFLGAKDLAAMFLFYQLCEDIPDFSITRTLNPHIRTMAQWITDNKEQLLYVLENSLGKQHQTDYIKPPHLRVASPMDAKSSANGPGVDGDEDEEEDGEATSEMILPACTIHLIPPERSIQEAVVVFPLASSVDHSNNSNDTNSAGDERSRQSTSSGTGQVDLDSEERRVKDRSQGRSQPAPTIAHPAPPSIHSKPDSTHQAPSNVSHSSPTSPHSKPASTHKAPTSTHVKSTSTHQTPHSSHPKPASTHPAPNNISHQAPTNTQPTPTSTHSKPTSTHPAPARTNSKPASTHPAPASTHSKPSSTHPTPGSTHSKPSSTHPTPGSTHSKPASTHPTPGSIHSKPASTHPAPNNISHSAPTNTHSPPSNITHLPPTNTHSKPASTYPAPSNISHSKPASNQPTPNRAHHAPIDTHPAPVSSRKPRSLLRRGTRIIPAFLHRWWQGKAHGGQSLQPTAVSGPDMACLTPDHHTHQADTDADGGTGGGGGGGGIPAEDVAVVPRTAGSGDSTRTTRTLANHLMSRHPAEMAQRSGRPAVIGHCKKAYVHFKEVPTHTKARVDVFAGHPAVLVPNNTQHTRRVPVTGSSAIRERPVSPPDQRLAEAGDCFWVMRGNSRVTSAGDFQRWQREKAAVTTTAAEEGNAYSTTTMIATGCPSGPNVTPPDTVPRHPADINILANLEDGEKKKDANLQNLVCQNTLVPKPPKAWPRPHHAAGARSLMSNVSNVRVGDQEECRHNARHDADIPIDPHSLLPDLPSTSAQLQMECRSLIYRCPAKGTETDRKMFYQDIGGGFEEDIDVLPNVPTSAYISLWPTTLTASSREPPPLVQDTCTSSQGHPDLTREAAAVITDDSILTESLLTEDVVAELRAREKALADFRTELEAISEELNNSLLCQKHGLLQGQTRQRVEDDIPELGLVTPPATSLSLSPINSPTFSWASLTSPSTSTGHTHLLNWQGHSKDNGWQVLPSYGTSVSSTGDWSNLTDKDDDNDHQNRHQWVSPTSFQAITTTTTMATSSSSSSSYGSILFSDN